MSIALSGCLGSEKAAPVVVNNYCPLQVDLPDSVSVDKDIRMMSIETFKYIEITATTKKCECLESEEEKQQCWIEFNNLR